MKNIFFIHWNEEELKEKIRPLKKAGFKVGLISTVKILVDEVEYKATHTTPDSLTINFFS